MLLPVHWCLIRRTKRLNGLLGTNQRLTSTAENHSTTSGVFAPYMRVLVTQARIVLEESCFCRLTGGKVFARETLLL